MHICKNCFIIIVILAICSLLGCSSVSVQEEENFKIEIPTSTNDDINVSENKYPIPDNINWCTIRDASHFLGMRAQEISDNAGTMTSFSWYVGDKEAFFLEGGDMCFLFSSGILESDSYCTAINMTFETIKSDRSIENIKTKEELEQYLNFEVGNCIEETTRLCYEFELEGMTLQFYVDKNSELIQQEEGLTLKELGAKAYQGMTCEENRQMQESILNNKVPAPLNKYTSVIGLSAEKIKKQFNKETEIVSEPYLLKAFGEKAKFRMVAADTKVPYCIQIGLQMDMVFENIIDEKYEYYSMQQLKEGLNIPFSWWNCNEYIYNFADGSQIIIESDEMGNVWATQEILIKNKNI